MVFSKVEPARYACVNARHLMPTPPSLPALVKPPSHAQHWVSQISYLPDLKLLSIGTHTFLGVSENGGWLQCKPDD